MRKQYKIYCLLARPPPSNSESYKQFIEHMEECLCTTTPVRTAAHT